MLLKPLIKKVQNILNKAYQRTKLIVKKNIKSS